MKTTPCYHPKSEEDYILMIKLLYSLGYKMGIAETQDVCIRRYRSFWGNYSYLKPLNRFDGNLHILQNPNCREFATLGEFIEAAIEWLKPKALTVKLCFGLSATFTKNHVELNH